MVERDHGVSPHHLVAGFHVVRFESVNIFRQRLQQPVAHRVPVLEYPATSAEKTRPEYCVGHVLNNGAEQSAEIMRIVFEVGILHYDNITDLDFEVFALPQNP